MNQKEIIQKTEHFIHSEFKSDGSGHDWFHVDRVRKMALTIGEKESCDLFVVELAALLHDLDDWKLTGSKSGSPVKAEAWMRRMCVDPETIAHIIRIIEDVSYKGAGNLTPVRSKEAAVVQDADRLDAIGAIGIARTFAYGGNKNRLIYDPEVEPVIHKDYQEYKSSTAPTINHFFEKLLLLKDLMNTKTAKTMAERRHWFMESFLGHFFDEWDAKS